VKFLACFLFIILAFCSCKEEFQHFETEIEGTKLKITLEQYNDSSYALVLMKNDQFHSKWELDYPVYRFDYGDITKDEIPEIAVGVIKTTRFDPNLDKRLFIFYITDDFYIRPLWLGSRVAQPLVDFQIKKEKIYTIEKELSGNFLVAEYAWKGFGLEFKRYIERELTLSKAKKLLKKT